MCVAEKMFSSSSFYEEPNAIYPTVEEQVELCRKIAESLSDDCNLRSKGADMFFRRVKKAEKWIVAQTGEVAEESTGDPAQLPYVRPSKGGLPRLKLILDPRTLVDMGRLLREGVDIVDHNAMSPEVCHDIVKDLNSPTGKGAQLFAKRKKKSEEWVVDDQKVRHLLETRYQSSPEPPLSSRQVVESVMRAAEAKVMTYPNAIPHVPIIESLDAWNPDAYKVRTPKGWSGNADVPSESPVCVPQAPSALMRSMSFNNFNSSPRAWNGAGHFRPAPIRSVKPPSVLVQ
ncbi:uncharacterized protein LOC129220741 [Uloborus diversus]|uniref:uncharacterized protein LOC129220741 n=1 Tax=Uloborus diversus TaxID=327109 RepID=UPI00240A369F|nr:uncharacterized protein LOC129220741 [Uloborus diversus]